METRNLGSRLMLGAGIVTLIIGLFFLLYAASYAFVWPIIMATCGPPEGPPCESFLFQPLFKSILATGIALTIIGITTIVYSKLRNRKARNELIVGSVKVS